MLGVLDDDGTAAAGTQRTTRAPTAVSRAIHYKLSRIDVLGVEWRLVCAVVHIGTSKSVPSDGARGHGTTNDPIGPMIAMPQETSLQDTGAQLHHHVLCKARIARTGWYS
jgi:hypothetical protein